MWTEPGGRYTRTRANCIGAEPEALSFRAATVLDVPILSGLGSAREPRKITVRIVAKSWW